MVHIRFKSLFSLTIGMLLAVLATSCTLPSISKRATPSPDYTKIFATISVRLTQDPTATSQPATHTPVQSLPQTLQPTQPTLTPQNTPIPITPSPTVPCNRAAAGNPIDITIPDDTTMHPNESFSKTWRLINTGDCTWSTRYAIVFFSGQAFGAASVNYLPVEVNPGQLIDITIDMIAPSQPGSFQSNWKMADDEGQSFGIGPNGDAPFWVRILVVEPQTSTPEPTLTPSPSPTPAIIISGEITLTLDDTLNLDNLTLNPDSGADLIYQVDPVTPFRILTPMNGAQLGIFGQNKPEYRDCQNAIVTVDPLPVDVLSPDLYLCYRTNLGLPGWLRLMGLPDEDGKITLEILTWAIP